MPLLKRVAVAVALLSLASFILKDALFLGGAFFERDILTVYIPMADAFVRSIAEGAWPLRDTSTAFGQPLLGNPDAQVLYPTTWMHLLLLPEQVYPIFVLIHFFIGATGAAAMGWRISRSTVGSFFAGAFWLVSGPLQSFLGVWHHLAGAAWMPWVLDAFEGLLEAPDRRRALILASVFGLQILAGSADMCAMTLALALLRLVCEGSAASRARIPRQLRAALSALVIALLLGAGVWLTAADVVRSSQRASMPAEVRTAWSIHPLLTTEFVAPLSTSALGLNREMSALLFEGRIPFVRSLFLGPLVLPLFLAALFSPGLPRKYRVFAGLGVLICGLVSLGKYTPAYELITSLAPVLRIFRYPSKAIIAFSLLASVLAGTGVARLHSGRARGVSGVATILLIGLHLGLIGWAPEVLPRLAMPADSIADRITLSHLETNLLLSAGALVLLAVSLLWNRPKTTAIAALAGLLASLVVHTGFNGTVARSVLRFRPDHLAAVLTDEPSRLYVEDYVRFPAKSRRFLGRDNVLQGMRADGLPPEVSLIVAVRTSLFPPVAGSWGAEYAWDPDLRGLFDATLRDLTATVPGLEGTPAFLRMLQIANVSHVVALHQSSFEDLQLEQSIATRFKEPLLVFKVPETLPRAYAVSGVRAAGTVEAGRDLLDPRFSPATEVILQGGISRVATSSFRSSVEIVSRRSDRIVLDATLNEPGEVVLLEGFLPGWHATVDEVPVPVLRANALFVAVSAPAGDHRVVFSYRPWTAVTGLFLTFATALALLISLVLRKE